MKHLNSIYNSNFLAPKRLVFQSKGPENNPSPQEVQAAVEKGTKAVQNAMNFSRNLLDNLDRSAAKQSNATKTKEENPITVPGLAIGSKGDIDIQENNNILEESANNGTPVITVPLDVTVPSASPRVVYIDEIPVVGNASKAPQMTAQAQPTNAPRAKAQTPQIPTQRNFSKEEAEAYLKKQSKY